MSRTTIRALLAVGVAALCAVFAACPSRSSSSGSSQSAKEDQARIELEAEHIEGLLARRAEAANALAALTAVLPDRVWLTEVAYEPGKVRVKGRALSNNLLADYITRLGQSPAFTGLTLGGSVMRNVGGRESQEFGLEIALFEPTAESSASRPDAEAAARLRELEKKLPARGDPAGMLREAQSRALDAGLQMTRFAPGAEIAGEFTTALPVTVEVAGGLRSVEAYLRGLGGSPGLWVVDKLALRAVSPGEARSEFRASISARAHFAR